VKRLGIPLLIGLASAALVLALFAVGTTFLALMELKATDAMFRARGPIPAKSGKVAVVAVDERSLDQLGRWPWPRGLTARLIRAIVALGPRSLGLDMGFFEPDNRLPVKAVVEVARAAEAGRKVDLRGVLTRYHPDVLLARAVAQARDKLVLGYFFHIGSRQVAYLDRKEVKKRRALIAKFAFPAVRYTSPQAMERRLITAYLPEGNQPIINAAARWGGYFNVLPDLDGVVRRLPLVLQCGESFYPSLALVTLARFLGVRLPVLTIHPYGLEGLRLGEIDIPVDYLGRMRINYRGRAAAIPTVSAADVLSGRTPGKALAGKAVILSVTAAGLFDHSPTPFDRQLPGCYIHAQAMDNILAGDFLVTTDWTRLVDYLGILVLGLGGALLMGLFKPLPGAGLTALAGAGYVYGVYRLFLAGYLLGVIHPVMALVLAAAGVTIYRYLFEEREKRYVKKAFQYYLSPQVIEEVMKDPQALKLGGSKRELTVLFADIRGFTTLSEKLDPEVLAQVLNLFLDRMTRRILEQEGTLDKYIGDAIMAIFGAPAHHPDHALRACRAALALVRETRELEAEWERRGTPNLALGVGLNSGPMVVGNMGSSLRFDYTVIGDNVNLASRLEGQTRTYGVDVVVSQATRDLAAEQFHFRPLDVIRVKGRHEPVTIYELMGEADHPAPAAVELSTRGLELYLSRRFPEALECFQRILAEQPQDTPARILAERCRQLIAHPPGEDWDGVETKTSK